MKRRPPARPRRARPAAAAPAPVPPPAAGDYFEGQPLRLAPGSQLLLDDTLVEDRWRLTRELCPPDKHVRNPVLICDRPWEGGVISGVTVFFDESRDRFRMWYCAYFPFGELPEGTGRTCVCYAESEDGVNWVKPLSDRYPVGRHRRTNVVYRSACPGDPYAMVSQVFRDEADPDPARRYKMICYESRLVGGKPRRGVNLVVSPDGVAWRLDGAAPILDYNSDFTNHVVFDPVAGHWLLYCRPKVMHATGLQWKEYVTPGHPGGRHTSRRLAVMTSRDFRTWSYPRTCFYPDEHDTPDYDALSVFRCGSHFLMLYVAMQGDTDATKELKLASSPDGRRWERFHTRAPFIARGPAGSWDAGQIMRPATNPPVRYGSDLHCYYTGATKGQFDWHGEGGIGLVRLKPDRFVMQAAGDEPGFLITREFILEGNRLRLNTYYRKSKDCLHRLRVAILRRPPLGGHAGFRTECEGFGLADCDERLENAMDWVVTWRGQADLTPLLGQPVYLRFEMRNMGLFSFRTPLER
ncbi:MAG: hypothetical protein JNG83_15255 [Opitutaceae bacterium]|nr:hypothetical protein [Opitutaceae bacterium]